MGLEEKEGDGEATRGRLGFVKILRNENGPL